MFIHRLFEKTAEHMKDNIALSMDSRVLSYSELENLSNKISQALIAQGVKPGEIVGVCLKRSPELVATVLGILKSGAAYLPLNPEYPSDRLKYMVEHSRVKKIVAHEKFISIFNHSSSDILTFEKINLDQFNSSKVIVDESLIDLAYVIYTSGSTGNPKGVSLGHKALVNLIEWQNEQTIFKTNSITLQFTPLSFDVHFQEIFSTLTLGGKLVLIKEELRLDTYALLKTLSENNVNRLFLPYVALNHLSEIAVMHGLFPDSLKEVTTAGEQLKITPNIRSFFNKIPGAVLYNHYGPSETHVVTSLTLTGNADLWPNLPTIGKSISNVNTFILDENLNPVAKGSEGDIYLGGVCLANGYLHSPELTAERFLVKRNFVLNEETLKGKWKEARGEIQKMWGKLTDDDLDQAKGDLTALTGIIQQRYGESKESVQTKLNDYFGNAWTDVKQGVAKTAEKAKNAVSEASESAKQKL